jgi:hypothetical protein
MQWKYYFNSQYVNSYIINNFLKYKIGIMNYLFWIYTTLTNLQNYMNE